MRCYFAISPLKGVKRFCKYRLLGASLQGPSVLLKCRRRRASYCLHRFTNMITVQSQRFIFDLNILEDID